MSVLYLDSEYNGFNGQLISLALCPDDGTEPWYEVTELPKLIDPWVRAHVLPELGQEPLRPMLFKMSFHSYIQKFENPLIICDWHVDAVHFCQLLSGFDYGSSLDFEFRMHVLKTPRIGGPMSVHNALDDARILMTWHKERENAKKMDFQGDPTPGRTPQEIKGPRGAEDTGE